MSFLDCICCGFGAVILLLVLSKIYEPVIIEKTQDDLESLIALLQQELFDIRGETAVLNRELEDVRTQTSTSKLRLARLQGELSTVRGRYAATQQESEATLDEGALRITKNVSSAPTRTAGTTCSSAATVCPAMPRLRALLVTKMRFSSP